MTDSSSASVNDGNPPRTIARELSENDLEFAEILTELQYNFPHQAFSTLESAAARATERDLHEDLSPEERNRALHLLKRPDLLRHALRKVQAQGVVGEQRPILATFLVGVSRLLEDPLHAVTRATSSSGKNYLNARVLNLFADKHIWEATRFTGAALDRVEPGELKHKIIYLEEFEGARDNYSARIMMSRGELVLRTATKDEETGDWSTKENRVEGPVALLTTTTEADVGEDEENRLFGISLDESEGQTRRILQRRAAAYDGNPPLDSDAQSLQHLRNAQRVLEDHATTPRIPYARTLADAFPDDLIRVRRDFDKFLRFIQASTLTHLAQRPRDTEGRLLATPSDYALAKLATQEFLAQSLQQHHPKTKEILDTADDIGIDATGEGPEDFVTFTRNDLADQLGWSEASVRNWIQPLEGNEFKVLQGGQGKAYEYQLRPSYDRSTVDLPETDTVVDDFEAETGLSTCFHAAGPLSRRLQCIVCGQELSPSDDTTTDQPSDPAGTPSDDEVAESDRTRREEPEQEKTGASASKPSPTKRNEAGSADSTSQDSEDQRCEAETPRINRQTESTSDPPNSATSQTTTDEHSSDRRLVTVLVDADAFDDQPDLGQQTPVADGHGNEYTLRAGERTILPQSLANVIANRGKGTILDGRSQKEALAKQIDCTEDPL
jgi:hypothetical protein